MSYYLSPEIDLPGVLRRIEWDIKRVLGRGIDDSRGLYWQPLPMSEIQIYAFPQMSKVGEDEVWQQVLIAVGEDGRTLVFYDGEEVCHLVKPNALFTEALHSFSLPRMDQDDAWRKMDDANDQDFVYAQEMMNHLINGRVFKMRPEPFGNQGLPKIVEPRSGDPTDPELKEWYEQFGGWGG